MSVRAGVSYLALQSKGSEQLSIFVNLQRELERRSELDRPRASEGTDSNPTVQCAGMVVGSRIWREKEVERRRGEVKALAAYLWISCGEELLSVKNGVRPRKKHEGLLSLTESHAAR